MISPEEPGVPDEDEVRKDSPSEEISAEDEKEAEEGIQSAHDFMAEFRKRHG